MTYDIDRRTVLKGIGASAITLTAVGQVSAAGRSRYLASGSGEVVGQRIDDAGFTVQRTLANGQAFLVVGESGRLDELAGIEGVSHAERDFQFRMERPVKQSESTEIHDPVPLPSIDDDLYHLQWDKDVTSVPAAHDSATGDGRSIAVIDTGVGVNHPNLVGNLDVTDGRRFRSLAVGSDLESGQLATDPVQGGTGDVEVPANREDPTQGTIVLPDDLVNDIHGHGTNVSGIAAANPDVDGDEDSPPFPVTGTAPAATVLPLRVFWWIEADDVAALFTTTGDILAAIDYAAEAGVDAINMSIGTPPIPPSANRERLRPIYQTVIESAVRRGSVVVVSAGNSAVSLQNGFFTVPNSVAGAMSISATGPNDELVFYSNYGTNEIDVGAPGGGYETLEKTLETNPDEVDWPFPFNLVFNAYMADGTGDGLLDAPTYAWLAGTSMAAPQVTGTAALVREVAPDANAKQVEQAIEQGADLVQGKSDPELGAGRLNAAGAIDAANGG